MTDLDTIFTHFSPQDIEEFYRLYQLWSLQKKREQIISQMNELEKQILANKALFEAASPSAIALAALSQFRAVGVDDIDLLDRMLERGDEWLDHTLQLFERCERLDMLQGDTTAWCTHALEGAYDWIESMGDINDQQATDDDTLLAIPAISIDQSLSEIEPLPTTTEADFLQKLMSEDGEITQIASTSLHIVPDIQEYTELIEDPTQDLQPIEPDRIPEQTHPQPTEDRIPEQTHPQPTEPDHISEQIYPLAQLLSAPQPASNAAHKRASQARRSFKISSKRQKQRKKVQTANQYKRKHKRQK
jgi:hypothetical protein